MYSNIPEPFSPLNGNRNVSMPSSPIKYNDNLFFQMRQPQSPSNYFMTNPQPFFLNMSYGVPTNPVQNIINPQMRLYDHEMDQYNRSFQEVQPNYNQYRYYVPNDDITLQPTHSRINSKESNTIERKGSDNITIITEKDSDEDVEDDEDETDKVWDSGDDEKLQRAVKSYGENWVMVANSIKISSELCCKRWAKIDNLKKGPWTKEEDDILLKEVNKYSCYKMIKWADVASKLEGRIGKQCRERYINYLNPYIKRGEWTEIEDHILFELQRVLGNKWTLISKVLLRSDNDVKNHYYSKSRTLYFRSHPQPIIPYSQLSCMNFELNEKSEKSKKKKNKKLTQVPISILFSYLKLPPDYPYPDDYDKYMKIFKDVLPPPLCTYDPPPTDRIQSVPVNRNNMLKYSLLNRRTNRRKYISTNETPPEIYPNEPTISVQYTPQRYLFQHPLQQPITLPPQNPELASPVIHSSSGSNSTVKSFEEKLPSNDSSSNSNSGGNSSSDKRLSNLDTMEISQISAIERNSNELLHGIDIPVEEVYYLYLE